MPSLVVLFEKLDLGVHRSGGEPAVGHPLALYRACERLVDQVGFYAPVVPVDEAVGQRLVSLHVQHSLVAQQDSSEAPSTPMRTDGAARLSEVVVASAPVRIDLAGGWSDTPPICYEIGGAVSPAS